MHDNPLNGNQQTHMIRFSYPTSFRKALAISLGRPGEIATLPEVEEFIREAVTVNVQACIEDHLLPPRPKLKARMSRPSLR
jgi:hypothetical protein